MLFLAQPIRRPGVGERLSHLVSSGSTVTIDSIPDTTLSNKWIVTLSDAVDQLVSTYEVLAVNKFGTKVTHTIYGLIGDRVPHTLELNFNGSNVDVEITNTGINELLINIVRIDTYN